MRRIPALPGDFRAAIFFLTLSGLACAQESEIADRSLAPRREAFPVSKDVSGSSELPPPPARPQADKTPLGVRVRAIRLVARQDLVSPSAAVTGDGPVQAGEGVYPPTGLAERMAADFVGKDMSLALLQEMAVTVITAYRASDHPLVDVYLPEQDITEGKVQLVVREAVLGEVRVEGAKHSRPERLIRQVRIDAGERINSRILEEDLEWLNEAPGRTVDLIYERGKVDGTSDLVIRANDLRPIRAYTGYGNTGINATGQTEWNGGVLWNNVFGLDHVASYAFSGDAELDNLNAHSLVYQIPLPWRHHLDVLGAYVVSSTDLGGGPSPLGVDGESIQASATYRIPLPRPRRSWRHEVSLGWDYKSTNTDLLFGGASLFATTAEVFQFRVGYGATYQDDWGRGAYDLGIVLSPGDVLRRNTDADFSALRADTGADYAYLTASAQRFLELPAGFGFLFRADGQYTGDRLLSTEQLLAGGWRTVRGFDENLARGDSGVVLTSQLMLPTEALSARLSESVWPGDNRFAAFLFQDTAFLDNRGSSLGESDPSLHAAGLGFEWRGGEAFSLRGSYGWNLGAWGLGDVEDGKFHFGMSVRY